MTEVWSKYRILPLIFTVIEVYISFNNSFQGNGRKLSNYTSVRSLLQTARRDKTSYLSHNGLKKCVAWNPEERLPMIDISSLESENIKVYLSFNKPIHRNGQKLLSE